MYGSSLSDPAGSSTLVSAVQWLEGTLLGTIATTVAVISVASIGFFALSGRVDIRRAMTAVMGCFILFGASSIVAGLQSAMLDDGGAQPLVPMVSVEVSPLSTRPPRPAAYDPYAGAGVPTL
jgi:type IV secretion system protein VirB2